MDTVELPDHLFPAPCTITISGPSGSGKTYLTMDILKYRDQLFSQPVSGVIYCYSEMQDLFKIPSEGGPITYHHGMLTEEELEECIRKFKGEHFLIVYDDMMTEVAQSALVQDLASKLGHHRQISSITITQNIFVQGKCARTVALNNHFYFLTRTCRDLKQIATFGSQLFPSKGGRFLEIYRDSVDNPFSDDQTPHLLVSCHPFKTMRGFQLMANIFPPGSSMILYRI